METERRFAALLVEGGDGNVAGRTGCVVADLIAIAVLSRGEHSPTMTHLRTVRRTARARGNSGTAWSYRTTTA